MTLKKLMRLLQWIDSHDNFKMHGCHIWANGAGELALIFNTQPLEFQDRHLRKIGFILWDGEYIYRPRMRTRRTK